MCQLTVMLLLGGCELERVEPASPGSVSASAAVLASDLELIAAQIEEHALAIQAASDPEALAGGGPPPDLDAIRVDLEQLRARRDELASQLAAIEQLAAGSAQ